MDDDFVNDFGRLSNAIDASVASQNQANVDMQRQLRTCRANSTPYAETLTVQPELFQRFEKSIDDIKNLLLRREGA